MNHSVLGQLNILKCLLVFDSVKSRSTVAYVLKGVMTWNKDNYLWYPQAISIRWNSAQSEIL